MSGGSSKLHVVRILGGRKSPILMVNPLVTGLVDWMISSYFGMLIGMTAVFNE